MDPYSAPTPVWEMPKASKLYMPMTLVGNWYERQVLAIDVAKYDAAERARKALDVDRRIFIHGESTKPYAESGHFEDGSLHYGDTIHLSCVGMVPPIGHSHAVETPALAVNLHWEAVEDSGTARAYGSLTDATPTGRSIFTVKSGDRIEHPHRMKRVCFGDAVYLVSAIPWQGTEWRLTSALEHLYDINLDHRKQSVWLYPFLTKKSLWSFQHADRHLCRIMEGEPVHTRQPIMLRHVLTGRNLTVNFLKRFKNAYGIEYLMTVDVDRDIDKVEKTNSLFHIRQVTFTPWKVDEPKEREFCAGMENQILETHQTELNRHAYLEAADSDPNLWYPHPSSMAGRQGNPTTMPRVHDLR